MFFDDLGHHKLGEKTRPTVHRALEDVVDSYELGKRYTQFINELTNAYVEVDPDA
jgi:hypothetical protein